MAILDTHNAIEKIIATGVSKETAEAIVESVNVRNDELITKSDLRVTVSELKTEISELKMELKEDMHEINISMSKLRADMSEIKTDILKWILPFVATNTFAIVGLIITAFWKS